MSGAFEAATQVVQTGSDGRLEARIVEGWDIAGNANGGYLLAIAARAIAAETGRTDPVTISAHYLAPGPVGPVTIDTDTVRSGRRFSTGRATLSSGDRALVTALGTFGDFGRPPEANQPVLVDGGPPDLPSVDRCRPMGDAGTMALSFMDRVDLRLHPDDSRFREGARSGTARMRGWLRLPDNEPIDAFGLICAADALPPTIFNTDLPVGWTPTLELTVHIRARPAEGWLACTFSTRFVSGGFLEEDGEIWDSAGRLVAQSRQLALVPKASTPQV